MVGTQIGRPLLQALATRAAACGASAPHEAAGIARCGPAAGALLTRWKTLLPAFGGGPLLSTPCSKRWQSTAAASPATEGAEEAKPRSARAPRKKRDVLVMTDGAVERVKELLKDKDPAPHGIRLGVRTRGCNGLSYTLNYVYEPQKLDDIVEAGGVKVYIDPKAVMYLVGARMDFVEDAVKAEFVFENPNAKGACGCGESFNV